MGRNSTCFCGSNIPFERCCQTRYKSLFLNPNMNTDTANSYELWTSNRVSVWQTMLMLLNEMTKEQTQSIIIFGAGSCRDLPIDFICDTFKEIVLVDIDSEALSNSKKYIPTSLQHKVRYVSMDVTGLMDKFAHEILNGNINSYEKGIEYLNEISDKLPEIILPKDISDKIPFSFVASDLMLTQLCNNFLIKLSESIGSEQKIFNSADVELFSEAIILQHLNLLHKVSSLDGKIMILVDTFTFGYEIDGSELPFNRVIYDYNPSVLNMSIDNFTLTEWYTKYPAIAGSNVFQVMEKHSYKRLEFYSHSNWWWTFSRNKRYFVNCYTVLPR